MQKTQYINPSWFTASLPACPSKLADFNHNRNQMDQTENKLKIRELKPNVFFTNQHFKFHTHVTVLQSTVWLFQNRHVMHMHLPFFQLHAYHSAGYSPKFGIPVQMSGWIHLWHLYICARRIWSSIINVASKHHRAPFGRQGLVLTVSYLSLTSASNNSSHHDLGLELQASHLSLELHTCTKGFQARNVTDHVTESAYVFIHDNEVVIYICM